MENQPHRWRFFRAGGVDQARIDTGDDLRNLAGLDLKLWAAVSCPVKGLDFDARTLALLDANGDGRIRAPEVLAAVKWACAVLRDPDVMVKAPDAVKLAWLNDATPEGAAVLASARRVLAGHGRPDADEVTVTDAVESAVVLAKARLNGDGVQPPAALEDPWLAAVATDAIACVGGEPDRGGETGVSQASLACFFDELAAFDAWQAKARDDAASVLPLGEATEAAAAALREVRAKIEDFFARCRLASFDTRATVPLNRGEDDYKALSGQELSATAAAIAAFPLARVEPARALPLTGSLNPAWAAAMTRFRDLVVDPVVGSGKATLTEAEFERITARFAPFEAWRAAKAGARVEPLGAAKVRELLASDARARLTALIEADLAVEPEMKSIVDVERIGRYAGNLHRLLNNYVSFSDFFSLRQKAVFQAGTLFVDGRACDLCLRVEDPGRHAVLAGLSRIYLAYCDCTRPDGQKMTILAAVTAGDSDHLMAGRNGLFFDGQGCDWDATITKVVENPISLREAFWSPYKRFMRMVEEQVAKRAAAADAESHGSLSAAATATAHADRAKPAEPKKIDIGTVAALGVAVGGITAALGMLLQAFFGLGLWMPLGVVGLVLAVSGPSMLIAGLKLRQRNLGPILDASGWAVNALVRINVPFGTALTRIGRLPPGSERSLADPYAEKKRWWPKVALAVLLLALATWGLYKAGYLSQWIGCDTPAAEVVPVPPAPPPK